MQNSRSTVPLWALEKLGLLGRPTYVLWDVSDGDVQHLVLVHWDGNDWVPDYSYEWQFGRLTAVQCEAVAAAVGDVAYHYLVRLLAAQNPSEFLRTQLDASFQGP